MDLNPMTAVMSFMSSDTLTNQGLEHSRDVTVYTEWRIAGISQRIQSEEGITLFACKGAAASAKPMASGV